MIPSKQNEHLALGGSALLALLAGLALGLGLAVSSLFLDALAMLAGVAAAVAMLSLVHAAMQRLAAEESREEEELERSRQDRPGLFAGDAEASRLRARNLAQFERYFVPALTLVLGLAEILLAALLYRVGTGRQPPVADPARALLAASLLAVSGIVLYLFGSFVAGLAFGERRRELRAVASESIGLAWLAGLGLVAMLLVRLGLGRYDVWAAALAGAVLVLRGLEKFLSVVVEQYRPRRSGESAGRLLYESRLYGFLAQPHRLFASLSESLNYQFGLQVSEAAFKRGLLLLAPLVLLFHVVVLGLFSCLLFVNPGEQALRERWGRPWPPADPLLEPGLHLLLPWPMDKVYREPVDRVRVLVVTTESRDKAAKTPDKSLSPAAKAALENTVLWRDNATESRDLLVAAGSAAPAVGSAARSFDLAAGTLTVHYRIRDLRRFLRAGRDAEALLATLARRELARYCASHTLFQLLAADRERVARQLAADLQAAAAAPQFDLGLEILYTGLEHIQPAAPVAESFQDVIAAGEDALRLRLDARGQAARTLSSARADAVLARSDAEGYKARRAEVAGAERDNFLALEQLSRRDPHLFRLMMYLDALELALAGKEKIVVATRVPDQFLLIDLKDKGKTELFDLAP